LIWFWLKSENEIPEGQLYDEIYDIKKRDVKEILTNRNG